MKDGRKTVTAVGANPTVYIIPALILGAAALYYLYGAVDSFGLDVRSVGAVVTGKQFASGNTTYHTTIAGGRAWTQSQENPDMYVVSLSVEGEETVGLVSAQMFQSLAVGDRVHVKVQRTRISNRLEVVDVSR